MFSASKNTPSIVRESDDLDSLISTSSNEQHPLRPFRALSLHSTLQRAGQQCHAVYIPIMSRMNYIPRGDLEDAGLCEGGGGCARGCSRRGSGGNRGGGCGGGCDDWPAEAGRIIEEAMPFFAVEAHRQSRVRIELERLFPGADVQVRAGTAAFLDDLALGPGEVVPLERGVLAAKVEGLEGGGEYEGEDIARGGVEVRGEDVERCEGAGRPYSDCAVACRVGLEVSAIREGRPGERS
jgi:hypothetical protein